MERAEMWLHLTLGSSLARRRSTTTTATPRLAKSIASVRPTGPPPTTTTRVAIDRLAIRVTPCLTRTNVGRKDRCSNLLRKPRS